MYVNGKKLDRFTAGYVECALWSSVDPETGDPLDDDYGPDDLHPDTLKEMIDECIDFQVDNEADLEGIDPEQAGHDFWLTRNRHGAGFWDRGLGKVGRRLTDAAHVYGSVDLWVDADGKVRH